MQLLPEWIAYELQLKISKTADHEQAKKMPGGR